MKKSKEIPTSALNCTLNYKQKHDASISIEDTAISEVIHTTVTSVPQPWLVGAMHLLVDGISDYTQFPKLAPIASILVSFDSPRRST